MQAGEKRVEKGRETPGHWSERKRWERLSERAPREQYG